MPTASIIIPTYNGREYLRDCLASLDRQTWRDFDLIVVDNGSTDGTAAAVRQAWPAVHVIEAGRKTAEGAPEEVLGPRDGLVDVSFVLRDTDVAPARTLLERTGWPVRIEAGRLTATVDGPRKIEPLRALLEEGFEILDFELGGRRPR